MMLKIDHGDDVDAEEGETAAAKIGYTEFISHTTWAHQLDFDEWRRRYVRRSYLMYGRPTIPIDFSRLFLSKERILDATFFFEFVG